MPERHRPDSPPTGITLVLLGVVLGVVLVILLGWVNAPQQQDRADGHPDHADGHTAVTWS